MWKVAFICVHNSCRSQIAEALGKHLASDVFESYSAGTERKERINPDAVRLMKALYHIDMEADGRTLTLDNIRSIARLEPFGEGNKQPVFLLKGCRVLSKRSLKEGKYYSLEVESAGARLKLVDFRRTFAKMPLEAGAAADIAVTAELSDSDTRGLTLKICDIRSADFRDDRFFAAKRVYEAICRGEEFDKRLAARIIPDREALKGVFDLLRKYRGLSAEEICVFGGDMNYCMLRVALDAFAQAGMLKMNSSADEPELIPVSGKRDLFSQGIIAELKEKCAQR